MHPLSRLCSVLVFLLLLTPGFSAGRRSDPLYFKTAPNSAFVFQLLPKSLQSNPELFMSVITEMTDDGRRLPQASQEHPVYFEPFPGAFQQFGASYAGVKTPPVADLERLMKAALAQNGYLPAAAPDHPPSLVIIYNWGMHNKPIVDAEFGINFYDLRLNRREREALVYGSQRNPSFSMRSFGIEPASQSGSPSALPASLRPTPDERYEQMEILYELLQEDVYFVTASAYDYASIARGEKRLLWRTKMVVDAMGVSLYETLTPLVANAAPYLGRETGGPLAVARRITRWGAGKVDIGPLQVQSFDESSRQVSTGKK